MNYKFVQNKKCEYFPCHKVGDETKFNCLFCYCPLYMLGEECGGNFKYSHGIKDCSGCTITHMKDTGFNFVQEKMLTVIDIVKENYLENHTEEENIKLK
ncbi:MAG: cysteine-rich small domain-containing protein [Psychrilyobacter sp.]|nr:cysteine-rich small domain-containing protein [Psychrilyobacter sp.]